MGGFRHRKSEVLTKEDGCGGFTVEEDRLLTVERLEPSSTHGPVNITAIYNRVVMHDIVIFYRISFVTFRRG